MTFKIYGKDGSVKAEAHKLEYSGEFMGECYVTTSVSSPTPIDFEVGDYLVYRGETFAISTSPSQIKQSRKDTYGGAFEYSEVRFESYSRELVRCMFLDYVRSDNQLHYTALPEFSFYAQSIRNLIERIQVNLDRLYTGDNKWTIVLSKNFSGDKDVNISVNNINCWEALALVNSEFNANFIIRGRTITVGTEGITINDAFSYGKGNGLLKIERVVEQNQAIITRLRAYGSTKNLPRHYYGEIDENIPNNYAVNHLMLPTFPSETYDPYIDATVENVGHDVVGELGIREASVFFDGSGELEDIYPTIEGTGLNQIVSAEQITDNGIVSDDSNESENGSTDNDNAEESATNATFYVVIKDLGFDINDYLLEGETATMSFKSGMCAGREFEIVSVEENEGGGYKVTLNRAEDKTINLYFPYNNFNVQSGDTYVLLGIRLPDEYVRNASERLLSAAKRYLNENCKVRYTYTPTIDNIWMQREEDSRANKSLSLHNTIKEGDVLKIRDNDLGIAEDIIIDKLVIKEGNAQIPEYEISLSNDKTVSVIQEIQNRISDLEVNGGGGDISIDKLRYILNSVGKEMFISKKNDDYAKGKITFRKGLKSLAISTFGNYKTKVIEVDENGELKYDEVGNPIYEKVINPETGEVVIDEKTGLPKEKEISYDGQRITEKGNIVSGDYKEGVLGVGSYLGRYEGTQDTYLEIDRMLVRKKAQFTELEIDELTQVGGRVLISPAAETCAKVEAWGIHSPKKTSSEVTHKLTDNELKEETTVIEWYRCFFVADDGEKSIENEFKKYDQVRCQSFNIDEKDKKYQNISNTYWWRVVINTGKDYIDLSNRETEPALYIYHESDPKISDRGLDYGSDAPMKGDNMVVLGNRVEPDRQRAIVLSSYGNGSPYIAKYADINDFTMANCEVSFDGFDSEGQIFREYGSFFFGDKGDYPTEYIRFKRGDGDGHGTLEICASKITLVTGDTKDDIVKAFEKLNGEVEIIRAQNDKEYTIWFGESEPTFDNEPTSEWDTDELKMSHVQDIYYNKDAGTAYRFENMGTPDNPEFVWNEITDADTLRALEMVKQKTTVHFQTSVEDGVEPPYNVGDTWSNATYIEKDENGNLIYDPVLDEHGNPTYNQDGTEAKEPRYVYNDDYLVCVRAKGVGEAFDIDDWRPTNWFSRAIFDQEKDKITTSVTNMVQLSKEDQIKYADELAKKGLEDAQKYVNEMMYGEGGASNPDEGSVFYSISVAQQKSDSIYNAVYGLDADGNSIQGAGAVFKSDFATMFAEAYEADKSTIKRAEIAAFVKKGEDGNLESGVGIKADQIDFSGKKINLSADEVNINSDAINISGTDLPSYISQFYSGGSITAPISGGVSGTLHVADGTALTWTNGILTGAN